MKIAGIIPARYNSTRLPGKPLINILGKSMIQRVYEQSKKCSLLTDIIVATDDKKIYEHVLAFGGKSIITSQAHKSGTDRCNEVANKLYASYDLIINIQGDEPFISPKQIEKVIALFKNNTIEIGTLAKEITNTELIKNRNYPKAIFDKNMFAIDFCREIISASNSQTYYKHIGIYGFRRAILNEICNLPESENEKIQKLEQLRWLDNNYNIKIAITTLESLSVDTPDDIAKIEAQMR